MAKLIQLISSTRIADRGTSGEPAHDVDQLFHPDGTLLAESDPVTGESWFLTKPKPKNVVEIKGKD